MRAALAIALVVLIGLVWPQRASAHEVRPAYLEITETRPDVVDVVFKRPVWGQKALRLAPRLSGDNPLSRRPDTVDTAATYQIEIWRDVDLGNQGLSGRTIAIDGLERTMTDTLVVVERADGNRVQDLLRPERPSLQIDAGGEGMPVLAYLSLGIRHILTGYDHLLFVLGLMLLTRGLWDLVRTVTAFTVAHSITLAATALGYFVFSPVKLEILVALSIVFVAVEAINLQRGRDSPTLHRVWLIAFAFGLLHGSAFAGALAEIGLPQGNIPGALLLFNAGVEVGQLLFIALLSFAGFAIVRFTPVMAARFSPAPAYLIGIAACFWLFERIGAAIV